VNETLTAGRGRSAVETVEATARSSRRSMRHTRRGAAPSQAGAAGVSRCRTISRLVHGQELQVSQGIETFGRMTLKKSSASSHAAPEIGHAATEYRIIVFGERQ
jgi:hypothetical protein